MKPTDRRSSRIWWVARRAARRLGNVFAECHYAQLRLTQLRLHPDRFTIAGDAAPATYSEFLFRCSGPLWREPSARQRADGAPVVPVASRYAAQRRPPS